MKTKEQKKLEVAKRTALRAELTPAQQLAKLDLVLGKNQGAQRERARLSKAVKQ